MFFSKAKLTIARFSPMVSLMILLQSIGSCNQASETDVKAYKILNNCAAESASLIEDMTDRIYLELEGFSREPSTAFLTLQWQSVINNVRVTSDKMAKYLAELKRQLLTDAAIKGIIITDSLGNDQLSEQSKWFSDKKMELIKKLSEYQEQVFDTAGMPHPIQKEDFIHLKMRPEFQVWDTSAFDFESEGDISLIGSIALLSTCESRIRSVEHSIIKRIYNSMAVHDYFTKLSMITSLSSNVVKRGGEIELMCGMGKFDLNDKIEYIIDGRNLKPNESGVVTYVIHASEKSGTYSIPIKLKLLDRYGNAIDVVKKVSYEVIDGLC